MFKTIAIFSFAAALLSMCLANGIEAEFEIKNLNSSSPAFAQKLYVSGDKINMQTNAGENKGTFIFRGDKELIWVIDHQNRQYSEMTKETMRQMAQTMSSAMSQWQTQIAAMPPEQRAMMEKMMKGQMNQVQAASAKEPPLAYKRTGTRKTINGYSCEKYDVFRGTEKLREMWIAEWKNMKDFNEAMTAFNSMGKFFSTMMESLKDSPFAKLMDNPYSHTAELNGFPVLSTELKDGIPVMEMTLKSVTKKTLSDSYFVPPADYKANESMFGPQKPESKKK